MVMPRPGSEGNHTPAVSRLLDAPHQQLEDSIIVPPAQVIEPTPIHPIHAVHHKKYVHGEYKDYTPAGDDLNMITEEPLKVEVISESLYTETLDLKANAMDANTAHIADHEHEEKKNEGEDQSLAVALTEGDDRLQVTASSVEEQADVIQRISSMSIFTPSDKIDLTQGSMHTFGKLSIVNASIGATTTSTFVFDETVIHERNTLVSSAGLV